MIKVHFTYSNSIFSKFVTLFTGDKYTHVEIEVDGYCYSAKPFKGVYKTLPSKLIKLYGKYTDTYTIENVSECKVDKVKKFLEEQVGKGYDYKSAIACGLWQRDWANDDARWFCSELVAAALLVANIRVINQYYLPYKLTPRDLSLSPLLIA